MRKNVGSLDAFIRIAFGLYGLAWGISRMTWFRWGMLPRFITLLSAMKIAEGITRFCPLLALLGISTVDDQANKKAPYATKDYARRKVIPPQAPTEEKGVSKYE